MGNKINRRSAFLIEGVPVVTCSSCGQSYMTAQTLQEIERNIREAIGLHLEGWREDGEPIPEPHTVVAYVELQGVA